VVIPSNSFKKTIPNCLFVGRIFPSISLKQEAAGMARKRNSHRSGSAGTSLLGKPQGIIQPRMQAVGPERFGIVAVDCAKPRSKWMLCDFYGRVLIPPTIVEHGRAQLQLATVQLREACQAHGLKDHLVAVEMTGTYHRPIQRAFRQAGSETRLVHPFATRHYRQPASPDTKTDDKDLEAIFRAAVNGFGLLEPPPDETYQRLQILGRSDTTWSPSGLSSSVRFAPAWNVACPDTRLCSPTRFSGPASACSSPAAVAAPPRSAPRASLASRPGSARRNCGFRPARWRRSSPGVATQPRPIRWPAT
jgi:hypothetical protein